MTTNASAHKFGSGDPADPTPHDYGDVYAREVHPSYTRLTIGPSSSHVEVMLRLAEHIPPPFGLLYVLVTPLTDREPGRYQSCVFDDLAEPAALLRKYRDFLETDARHHLWLMNVHGQGQLIYDRHNVIYAYGPLDAFEQTLADLGLSRVDDIAFPVPHCHNYHQHMTRFENELFDELDWKWCPLVEEHDDP